MSASSGQLSLDVEPAAERCYTCCGRPCGPVAATADFGRFPHAPDCPNPNLWMLEPDGSPRKLLWCNDAVRIAWRDGIELPCPYEGGAMRGTPPGGRCCKDMERGAAGR